MTALEAFGLGRLSEEESREIELHLEECDAWRRKLEHVPDDGLIRLLQAAAAETHADFTEISYDTVTTERVTPGFTVPRELDGHERYHVLELLGTGGMG